jgi:hypothetical protein
MHMQFWFKKLRDKPTWKIYLCIEDNIKKRYDDPTAAEM